jgi:hypothetical protein
VATWQFLISCLQNKPHLKTGFGWTPLDTSLFVMSAYSLGTEAFDPNDNAKCAGDRKQQLPPTWLRTEWSRSNAQAEHTSIGFTLGFGICGLERS